MKKYLNHTKIVFALPVVFVFLLSLVSCTTDTEQKIENRNWELTWSDEFDGSAGTLPNNTKWAYDIGAGGWGNQELQYYTDRPQNVSLDGNGNLVITARSENFSGSQYTSARIKTQGIFSQKYGRFEARIKAPFGTGVWPAFWMLGENISTVSWPACGEIDIMEIRGQFPSITNSAIHGPGYSAGNSITNYFVLEKDRFDKDFHLYVVEWDADKIDFFIDNYLYHRITKESVNQKGNWVFDQPFFILLNIAVGGTFVGPPTSDTPLPQKMTIDYVRAYKLVQ